MGFGKQTHLKYSTVQTNILTSAELANSSHKGSPTKTNRGVSKRTFPQFILGLSGCWVALNPPLRRYMRFKKKEIDNEDITVSYLRSLDNKAYNQLLKAVDIYREGDKEMDKFRGKNITEGTPEFME